MRCLALVPLLAVAVSAGSVFVTDYEYQADDEDGLWFFCDYDYQADFTIHYVDYEYQAELKVYFVDYEYQAGWREGHPWQGRLQ